MLQVLIFTLGLFLISGARLHAENIPSLPTVKEGSIELSGWVYERKPLKLKGEWGFYFNKHFSEEEMLSESFLSFERDLIKAPGGRWEQVRPGKTKALGFPSYVIRVVGLISDEKEPLGLQMGQFAANHETFLVIPAQKKLVRLFSSGITTDRKETTIPQSKKVTALLPPLDGSPIYIVIRAASLYQAGTVSEVPVLASYARLQELENRQLWEAFWVLGMFSLLVISNLSLFALRPEDKPSLLIAVFSIIMGLRFFATEGLYSRFWPEPHLGLATINTQILGLAFPLGLVTYFTFVKYTFEDCLPSWLVKAAWLFVGIDVVLTMTLPPIWGLSLFFFFVMPLFVMSLFMIYRLARLIFQRARGAAIALLGISALIGAMFNDVLVWMDTYSFLYIGHYGMIAFIFAQSLVVGSNFAFAFRTADKLSRDLKIEVDRQTRDVKTILKNINQGILTVRTGLKIGDDYSACLSSILECERVAGEDVRSLILAKSNLTNEQRDLVASILTGCLDESPLNFELNSDNLPREIIFHGQEGKAKYLLVDWCPVVDEKRDLIEKILVTLRDITELKVMEEAHKAQRRDMDLIGEIIEVPVDRFDQFMSSSRNFLSENKRLMESMGNVADFSILKLLFINMHTIKGAARTFHFSRMTSVVHDCEQNLASVQKGFQAWDKKQAWDDLRAVESVFLEYEHIHQEKLKRSDGKESVRVDLETVRENIRALDSIGHLTLDADMTPFVDQVRRTFFQLYYTNLENILRELGKCLPTLARDLSKADPVVQIQALGFGINREGADALRHTFVHIFRNIMDHGIEEPEVRQKNGKPLHGLIRLEARSLGEQAILIEVSDDGRGLHLDRIKELALKRGVISETGQSTPEEVAELIFQDGFSTAKCVTDISGRGVGMSAVREYIEKIGGKVFIVLKDKPDTRSYVSFVLCIELPASVCTLEQNIKEVA